MISNSDMKEVLKKINCKLIVLAGDTYQIEAIELNLILDLFLKLDRMDLY